MREGKKGGKGKGGDGWRGIGWGEERREEGKRKPV